MARRSQKQCIFCDNGANSKEHFWPVWMHELLPQLDGPRHDRRLFTYDPKGDRYRASGVTGRSGGIRTIKIRVVCSACNSGWMSALEAQARPLLTPLVLATPVALDFEQMTVIARWIALKCIVAEHDTPGTSVTPEHDRRAFRERGVIPDYFSIYVANHNLPKAAGFIRHALCAGVYGPTPDPPLLGTGNNVQTISFVLGSVFVHVNAARINDFSLEDRYVVPLFHGNCRIWPVQHYEMVWPRRPLLDRDGMRVIAETIEFITKASKVTWIDPS